MKALYTPEWEHHWIPAHYRAALDYATEIIREAVEAAVEASLSEQTPREPLKDYGLVPNEDKCSERFYADGQTLLCQKPIGHGKWHESGDYEWKTESVRKP